MLRNVEASVDNDDDTKMKKKKKTHTHARALYDKHHSKADEMRHRPQKWTSEFSYRNDILIYLFRSHIDYKWPSETKINMVHHTRSMTNYISTLLMLES